MWYIFFGVIFSHALIVLYAMFRMWIVITQWLLHWDSQQSYIHLKLRRLYALWILTVDAVATGEVNYYNCIARSTPLIPTVNLRRRSAMGTVYSIAQLFFTCEDDGTSRQWQRVRACVCVWHNTHVSGGDPGKRQCVSPATRDTPQ